MKEKDKKEKLGEELSIALYYIIVKNNPFKCKQVTV